MKKLHIFLSIIIFYSVMKTVLYLWLPVNNFETWIIRDTWMNIPRLICGFLGLYFSLKLFSKEECGFHFRGFKPSLILFIAFCGVLIFIGQMSPKYYLSSRQFLTLSISSFIVAFHEEIVFRILGLNSIREVTQSRYKAVIIVSAIFAVWHVGAQPVLMWPFLFIVGVLYAQMRIQNISIFWIMIIHGSYDALWFVLAGDISTPSEMAILTGLVLMVVSAYELLFFKNSHLR